MVSFYIAGLMQRDANALLLLTLTMRVFLFNLIIMILQYIV